MSKSKKYLFSTLFISFIFLSIIAGFNYSIDPQYVYNVRSHNIFHHDQRSQNPGLARNIAYDTAIIGTSHTENTRSIYVDKIMGTQALKLSMADSTGAEQHKLLNIVLKNKKLKTVIWGVDYFSFLGAADRMSTGGEFPDHLYDLGINTAFKYLLSKDTLKFSINAVLKNGTLGINQRNIWLDLENSSSEKLLYAWQNECNHPRMITRKKLALDRSFKQNMDENIKHIIASHPDVKFKLFLPSFSAPYHLFLMKHAPKLFAVQLEIRRKLEALNNEYSNVELYDFQYLELTKNYDLYQDLTHYNASINEVLIDHMHHKEYLVKKGSSTQQIFLDFLKNSNLTLPPLAKSCTAQ